MSREVHSAWTKILVAALILLLGGAFLVPWFSYEYTTGQQHPPEYNIGNNTTSKRYDLRVYPFDVRGTYNATNESAVLEQSRMLGKIFTGAIALAGLALLIELVGGGQRWGRYAGIGFLSLSVLAIVAALLWTWYFVTPTMAPDGVTSPFTKGKWNNGFIATTIDWGWVVAAIGVPLALAALGFRFSAGAFDIDVMETYHTKKAQQAAPPNRPPPKA